MAIIAADKQRILHTQYDWVGWAERIYFAVIEKDKLRVAKIKLVKQ